MRCRKCKKSLSGSSISDLCNCINPEPIDGTNDTANAIRDAARIIKNETLETYLAVPLSPDNRVVLSVQKPLNKAETQKLCEHLKIMKTD